MKRTPFFYALFHKNKRPCITAGPLYKVYKYNPNKENVFYSSSYVVKIIAYFEFPKNKFEKSKDLIIKELISSKDLYSL